MKNKGIAINNYNNSNFHRKKKGMNSLNSNYNLIAI